MLKINNIVRTSPMTVKVTVEIPSSDLIPHKGNIKEFMDIDVSNEIYNQTDILCYDPEVEYSDNQSGLTEIVELVYINYNWVDNIVRPEFGLRSSDYVGNCEVIYVDFKARKRIAKAG